MRLLVLTLVAVLAAVLAVLATQMQGGRIIVHLADYTANMSLLMALLLGIGAMFGFFALVWTLSRLMAAPQRIRSRNRNRRRRHTDALLARGLRAMLEDAPDQAQRDMAQAAKISPKHPLLRLLAAAAATQTNDRPAWEQHLRAIDDPAYQQICAMLRADGLVAAHEWEEALAVLQAPDGCDQQHPRTLRHLARCYRELSNWTSLLELAQSPTARTHLLQNEVREWQQEATGRLCAKADGPGLKSLWPKLAHARDDPEVLRMYAAALQCCGTNLPELEQHVRSMAASEAGMELYANLPDPVTHDMIRHAESWLKREPERSMALRTLARLHARLGEWEPARRYLERAVQQGSNAALCRELAEALEQLGLREAAQDYYREGLETMTRAPDGKGNHIRKSAEADSPSF